MSLSCPSWLSSSKWLNRSMKGPAWLYLATLAKKIALHICRWTTVLNDYTQITQSCKISSRHQSLPKTCMKKWAIYFRRTKQKIRPCICTIYMNSNANKRFLSRPFKRKAAPFRRGTQTYVDCVDSQVINWTTLACLPETKAMKRQTFIWRMQMILICLRCLSSYLSLTPIILWAQTNSQTLSTSKAQAEANCRWTWLQRTATANKTFISKLLLFSKLKPLPIVPKTFTKRKPLTWNPSKSTALVTLPSRWQLSQIIIGKLATWTAKKTAVLNSKLNLNLKKTCRLYFRPRSKPLLAT